MTEYEVIEQQAEIIKEQAETIKQVEAQLIQLGALREEVKNNGF